MKTCDRITDAGSQRDMRRTGGGVGGRQAGDSPGGVRYVGGAGPQGFRLYRQQDKERYPGYRVAWAFTSQMIIDKLKKQGIETRNVAEVVNDLRNEGVKKVVFQSLHVVPGEEYSSLKTVAMNGLKVAFGDALMTTDNDIEAVIRALGKDIDAAQPTVVVAHGNDHHPEFNDRLIALAEQIETQYPNLWLQVSRAFPAPRPLPRLGR